MSSAISFEDFSFQYPRSNRDIIHEANFTIKKGTVTLLYGLSGSGKSTLCYAITGLIPWSVRGFMKGKVSVLGHSITERKPNQFAGDVGFLMQNPDSQFATLNVQDELIFAAENIQLGEKEIHQRFKVIIDLLDLHDYLDRNVTQLSGGEKQRVILGSILMMDPELIILDEPLACLDAKGRLQILEYLNNLKKINNDLTILIAEHRIKEIIPHVNKYLLIHQGQIKLFDDLNEMNLSHIEKISKLMLDIPKNQKIKNYNQQKDF